MRTALAIALLQETDILILDEPTNFLDLLGIIWLQRHLQALEDGNDAPTLILVSHDRDFTTLCTDLLILKDKGLTYFHGDLPTYEASQSEKKIYLTKMKDAQEKQKTHLRETIARNMKEGRKKDDENKIRQAKSRQKKLDDRMGLQVSAKGTRFKLNRDLEGYHFTSRAAIEIEQGEKPVHVLMPEPFDLRFPGALIDVDRASFSWPVPKGAAKAQGGKVEPAKQTLKEVSLSVNMGDRIGILGLNGAGKSTLIRLLVGAERPTSGTVTTHSRLRLGYYSQHAVEALQELGQAEPELTALSLLMRDVSGGTSAGSAAVAILGESSEPTLNEGDLRGLLGSVGLPGRTASDTAVRRLSGGQLVRLALARMFWKRPQCLVLDEVTTHLDYETVGAMREALRDWPGAVVLVSHDRWFMRGVVEGIIDDPDSDSEGRSDEEDEADTARRRVVYRLRLGALLKLEGGVSEFEELMEKRVKKLLAS
jgi:ATPase subunit of ABC transporter with duplicated ATPase domains